MGQELTLFQRVRTSVREIKPKEDRRLLGILMVIISLICFTGIDSAAKWLMIEGMDVSQAVFLRYGVHLVLLLAFLLPLLGKDLFATKRLGQELSRGFMLFISTVLNFVAVSYLPLTVTSAIFFSLPLVLCALSVPFLGEHVGYRRWLAVLVGFVGVLIIVHPGAESFHWATMLSLGSVMAVAFYNIFNRKLAGVDSVYTQQFYAAAVATLCVTPFAMGSLSEGNWILPASFWSWVAFFAMGVFGGIGHLLLTTAHRFAGASTLAPFVYVQIIFMALSSWLIFAQPPDIWIWVGAPIVLASGLYIWERERKRAQK